MVSFITATASQVHNSTIYPLSRGVVLRFIFFVHSLSENSLKCNVVNHICHSVNDGTLKVMMSLKKI